MREELNRMDLGVHFRVNVPDASSISKEWRTITMDFKEDVREDMLLKLAIVNMIKTQLAHRNIMLGFNDLIQREGVAVAEAPTGIQALGEHRDLIGETLVLSKNKAVISTWKNADTWEEALTAAWVKNPLSMVDKILFRPRNGGCVIFAATKASKEQIIASRAAAKQVGMTKSGETGPKMESFQISVEVAIQGGVAGEISKEII